MDDLTVNLFSRYENRVLATEKRKLPIALVTGFLGSGKTTLLNHILSNRQNLRLMIAVNDYANMNIDGELFRQQKTKGNADGVVALDCGSFVCSLAKKFETAVWQLLQDDYAEIDYLVVECSGISNPALAIHALEKQFGKMTRAQLDTVICIIDTESLHYTLSNNEKVDNILIRQLMCSDIVVLNKLDLVDKPMIERVENYVMKLVPNIQIYQTSFCNVGLPSLLALEEADSQVTVLSHEGVKQKFYVPSVDKSKKFRHENIKKVDGDNHETYDDYLKANNLQTIEFNGITPFCINKFCNFIMLKFPHGIVRGKGFLWFYENRSARYSLQLTNRGRIHLEMEENGWEVQPQTTLIFVLHQSIDRITFEQQLLDLCVPKKLTDQYLSPSNVYVENIKNYLFTNDLFEVVQPLNSPETLILNDGIIYFRITPVIRYKMDIDHLKHHGIILNDVNDLFIKSLNYSGNTFFVYNYIELTNDKQQKHHHHHHHKHAHDHDHVDNDDDVSMNINDPQLVIIWSILGDPEDSVKCFQEILPRLIENAEESITEAMKHVTICNCGR